MGLLWPVVIYPRCEDCGLKHAGFGFPEDGKRPARWCAGCAKHHKGAVDVKNASKVREDRIAPLGITIVMRY
jgi:hypothetical protein